MLLMIAKMLPMMVSVDAITPMEQLAYKSVKAFSPHVHYVVTLPC